MLHHACGWSWQLDTIKSALPASSIQFTFTSHHERDDCRATGCFYSNPVNYMWRLLKSTGIAPAHIQGAQVCIGDFDLQS